MVRTGKRAQRMAPAPMLAVLGSPPRDAGWAVEWKFDGQRATVVVDGADVAVFSRSGADVTRAFPELSGVAAALGQRRAVLDGEIIAPARDGLPSFSRLQQRWPQNRRPTPELLRQVPVQLVAFDVLALDGEDVTAAPYVERRAALDALAPADGRKAVLAVPKAWTGVSPADMLSIAAAHRMEGIVAKRLDSPYRPGRSPLWVKCPVRSTAEVAIVGYWPASAPTASTSIGALLLGGRDEAGDLVVVGRVGTGFSSTSRRHLYDLLQPIESPHPVVDRGFYDASGLRWVQPVYVGEVAYREYTPGGRLRHASWKGLRTAVSPSDVRLPA
ncbi:DNA ligase [Mycolicibacterium fortuitum]|uniref:DNA ligase (ATP) n=1 Tax=Mycolicibacterium fortuitum TaxID=1766 RepID=A0ABD6QT91_MYCFO|nr:non-homologous end-joining DNA ligase [Mycolicibacterium fortuitum]OMC51973.1 DNA ligase [Mycolicibacterium fortuitum]